MPSKRTTKALVVIPEILPKPLTGFMKLRIINIDVLLLGNISEGGPLTTIESLEVHCKSGREIKMEDWGYFHPEGHTIRLLKKIYYFEPYTIMGEYDHQCGG